MNFKPYLVFSRVLSFVLFMFLIGAPLLFAQSEKPLLRKIDSLKQSATFSKSNTEYIDLLFELSRILKFKNLDTTLLVVNEGIDLSKKYNYKKGEGFGYLRMADYYSQLSNDEKLKEYYNRALEISDKYKYDNLKVITLNNFGLNLSISGDFEQAFIHFSRGIELGERIQHKKMLSILYTNLAKMYSDFEDYTTALLILKKSINLYETDSNSEILGRTLINVADLQACSNDHMAAEKTVDKAISIFQEKEIKQWLTYAYAVKGYIYKSKGDFDGAIIWYNKSEKIGENLDDFTSTIRSYNGLAESYLGLGKVNKAEYYALESYKKSQKLTYNEGIIDLYSIFTKIYEAKGDYQKALTFQKKYIKTNKAKNSQNFKQGLSMYRTELKYKNEKELLIAAQNKEITDQKRITYFSLGALAFVLVTLILMYRNYKIQSKFNTLLKSKQEILLERESQLKQSNNTKDKLFSIIAHDLKGPINSFYGLLNMYVNGNVSKEEAENILPKAFQEIGGISNMLNNLLAWGRTQLNVTKNNPTNININALVKENIGLLNPLAQRKSIQIKNYIEDSLNSYCDKDQINIVIRNVLNNAIKFTNLNGEIVITAIKEDDFIEVSITDNGVGMDMETQTKLFAENNYNTTFGTSNEKGTGLGLNLCREMVIANHGEIWVTSTINKGSIFSFKIPAAK